MYDLGVGHLHAWQTCIEKREGGLVLLLLPSCPPIRLARPIDLLADYVSWFASHVGGKGVGPRRGTCVVQVRGLPVH